MGFSGAYFCVNMLRITVAISDNVSIVNALTWKQHSILIKAITMIQGVGGGIFRCTVLNNRNIKQPPHCMERSSLTIANKGHGLRATTEM